MSSLRDPKVNKATLVDRLRSEVGQMVQRRLKGLDYLTTPPPQIGVTPRTLLYRRGPLALYHYQPVASEVYRVPVLMIFAPTNNASILDLAKGQSLIEYMLKRGFDLYMVDWNAPSAAESHLKLDDYVLDFIPDAVRRVQQDSGIDELTMLGYCMGAVLSSLYVALHADGPVKNLVCFTMPTDWQKMALGPLIGELDVDSVLDSQGLVPARSIIMGVDMHRPAGRLAGQIRLWDNMWNDAYVAGHRMMTSWANDTLPLPG